MPKAKKNNEEFIYLPFHISVYVHVHEFIHHNVDTVCCVRVYKTMYSYTAVTAA